MAKNKVQHNDPKLREDIASFKASFAFIIFCMIIFLTASNLENNRATYQFRNFLDNNMWLYLIPIGLFAVSAVLRIRAQLNKIDESYSYFSTHDFLGLSSLFVVYSLTFAATNNILMYSIVVVGFAVGYYAKRFFGPDFYTVTIFNLAIAFGLWLKFGDKGWSTLLSKLSASLLAAGVVVTVIIITAYAVIRSFCKKRSVAIIDKAMAVLGAYVADADNSKLCIIPVFVSLVIGAVLALVLQFAPQYLTLLVAEIVLLVQYVALGVFYTVRIINQ